jgi:hypothetical protein
MPHEPEPPTPVSPLGSPDLGTPPVSPAIPVLQSQLEGQVSEFEEQDPALANQLDGQLSIGETLAADASSPALSAAIEAQMWLTLDQQVEQSDARLGAAMREEGEQLLADNVRREELQLEQRDPDIAATIEAQQAQVAADPAQAAGIDEQIVAELATVDPELAQNMAIEQDLGAGVAALPPAAEAQLEATVLAEEASFEDQHADLWTTVVEQQADAEAQIEQDPSRAAEIGARLERQVDSEVAAVDPQLAANLEKLQAEEAEQLEHGSG